jgi:hypothetical protein
MQAQSHMMFHSYGIREDGLSSVEEAVKEFPKKLDEFFEDIDILIRLAIKWLSPHNY